MTREVGWKNVSPGPPDAVVSCVKVIRAYNTGSDDKNGVWVGSPPKPLPLIYQGSDPRPALADAFDPHITRVAQ